MHFLKGKIKIIFLFIYLLFFNCFKYLISYRHRFNTDDVLLELKYILNLFQKLFLDFFKVIKNNQLILYFILFYF